MSLKTFLSPLWTPRRSAAIAAFCLVFFTAAVYLGGTNWKRALQHALFVIPFIGLWLISLSEAFDARPRLRQALRILAALGFLASYADAAVRGFIKHLYQAEPFSTFVLEAVANTSPSESFEFIASEAASMLFWLGVFAAASAGAFLIARFGSRGASGIHSRWGRWLWRFWLFFFAFFAVHGWNQLAWRIHMPPVFWMKWVNSVNGMQAKWLEASRNAGQALEFASETLISASDAPRTIVLVVGESTSRDAWSLYGYARNTTPQLCAIEAEDKRFAVIEDAWSVDSSTVPAFRSMFTLPSGSAEENQRLNLFALFAAAGWRIHWISNQDDMAIQMQYARFAAEADFINRMTGRSSASMDMRVLPEFIDALADPAPRKLIVVHLIGAHPHYDLRSESADRKDWGEDAVATRLEALDRSPWVVAQRNLYDWAMCYQDSVLHALIEHAMTAQKQSGEPLDWLFIADHGQELGETDNRLGHSPSALTSYRIPFLAWSSAKDLTELEKRPFRSDRLSPLLLALAGISWKGQNPEEVLTSDRYAWVPPALPVKDPDMPPPECVSKNAGETP